MAKITVDSNLNLPAIALAAGQPNNAQIVYRNGVLHVNDVTQRALDSALDSALLTADDDALAKAKEIALDMVDTNAGIARNAFLTIIPGQELAYLKKEIDAEKFKVADYPEADIADYPWIQAEANARGDTGQQVTDLILNQSIAWTVASVAIEEERIRGKVEIEQQQSVTGVSNASNKAKDAINNARPR